MDAREIKYGRWYCYEAETLAGTQVVRRGRCGLVLREKRKFGIAGLIPGRMLLVHEVKVLCEARPPLWRPIHLLRFRKRYKSSS